MKAIVYYEYGPPDVLRCVEVERPTPADDEVLLKVRAASVNPLDYRMMRGAPSVVRMLMRIRKPDAARPARCGRDVAGRVEAVGANVTRFKPGDEVFGTCEGAFAEYACARESKLASKPSNVSFEQAAAVPIAGLTALQGLRDRGRVRAGQKVLVNGAAGGVGTFAVQLAKSFGADVTGVCSARNVEMVRSIGAGHVVDYTREDFTKGGQSYDLILDCVGNHSLSELRRVLHEGGACVVAGAKGMGRMLLSLIQAPVLSRLGSRKFAVVMAKMSVDDLNALSGLLEAGQVTPVIDRSYGLDEAAEAVRYLGEGHARGKVIVIPQDDGAA